MDQKATAKPVQLNGDEERLRADRRLLGRLLGEVIREQIGAGTLELIENIRRSAVILRRGDAQGQDGAPIADCPQRAGNRARTACRSTTRCTSCVRSATSCIWSISPRTPASTAAARRPAKRRRRKAISRARSLRAKEAGIGGAQLVEWFATAVVSPVLTAHPTEVQRQSILDCEREDRAPARIARRAQPQPRTWRCAAKCCACGSPRCCG